MLVSSKILGSYSIDKTFSRCSSQLAELAPHYLVRGPLFILINNLIFSVTIRRSYKVFMLAFPFLACRWTLQFFLQNFVSDNSIPCSG